MLFLLFFPRYEAIPFKVLRFLFTEINYGGRVTDDKDRRLINNLIHTFCGPQVTQVRSRAALRTPDSVRCGLMASTYTGHTVCTCYPDTTRFPRTPFH